MKNYIVLIVFLMTLLEIHAQKTSYFQADDVLFYMEINGNNLNKKVNWDTFNQYEWVKELYQESFFKEWSDISQTGIDYSKTQYHWVSREPSVYSYKVLLPVKNSILLEKFIQTTDAEGIEISENDNYKSFALNDHVFVAWNEQYCMIISGSYIQYNDYDEEMTEFAEEEVMASDSIAISDYPSDYELENPESEEVDTLFDYNLEIDYLKDEIISLEEDIEFIDERRKDLAEEKKEYEETIANYKEDIEYLKIHHTYPFRPDSNPFEEEEKPVTIANTIIESTDSTYIEDLAKSDKEFRIESMPDRSYGDFRLRFNERDSLEYENLKAYSDSLFKIYFHSNQPTPKTNYPYKDSEADFFFSLNYSKIQSQNRYNNSFYFPYYVRGLYSMFNELYNMDINGNIYFKTDEITVDVFQKHNNPSVQKELKEVYNTQFNKKLTPFINANDLAVYSINLNSRNYIDYLYTLLKASSSEDKKNEKEVLFFMETLKVALDEEAIAEIVNGNILFSLHTFSPKEVTYIDYDYDDNYNYTETEKQKTVNSPSFNIVFLTENENFWRRFFDMMTSENFSENATYSNGVYTLYFNENNELNQLLFSINKGVVIITTDLDDLDILHGRNKGIASKDWVQKFKNNSVYGYINTKDIATFIRKDFENENPTNEENRLVDQIIENLGDFEFQSNFKNNGIHSMLNYKINSQHANSVMYFFNMFEKIFVYDSKKPTIN